ncbi:MAG: acylphosphatase [Janthinobacterium lividum]
MARPDDAVVRSRVVVSGRVQGVTYRDRPRRPAAVAGGAGWVRNLPDGSVEAELEGSSSAVEQVLAWMGTGPRLADVERVDVSVVPPMGGGSFEVR